VLHVTSVGTFMCDHHMPHSNDSLVISIKPEAKY